MVGSPILLDVPATPSKRNHEKFISCRVESALFVNNDLVSNQVIIEREMSGKVSEGKDRIQDLLRLDDITIEPVSQKKGLIVRHVEYNVKSEKFRSDVVRRYSDFQTLQELLLARFPYRLGMWNRILVSLMKVRCPSRFKPYLSDFLTCRKPLLLWSFKMRLTYVGLLVLEL